MPYSAASPSFSRTLSTSTVASRAERVIGPLELEGATYLRTREELTGSLMSGSRRERGTRWNVAAFFLSMNLRGMPTLDLSLVQFFGVQSSDKLEKFGVPRRKPDV